ncbi:MAG: histidine phosphatase family protein [Chloroflexi bacterium]|nr:histidine phosphatase family protein [Chloroflexota bacterium]
MAKKTVIHFVRHGLVQNPKNTYYGRLSGFPLNDRGQLQAGATRDYFSEKLISAFYSSPQLRARETAQIIADAHKNNPVIVSDLLNATHSPFDGYPKSVIEERNWDVFTGVGLNYEQPQDILARGRCFIFEAYASHFEEEIVAVTHGDLIAFLILWAKGIPCTSQNGQLLYEDYLGYGCVNTFTFEFEGEWKLLGIANINPLLKGKFE